jgi:DMSO/TMAO reductase YedYZ molybdopterin-dependent catalytic subunit
MTDTPARSAPAPLVLREHDPPQLEATLEALDGQPVTPVESFYVRSHTGTPRIDPHAWRLAMGGAVRAERRLTLEALRALPAHEQAVTLECAGVTGGAAHAWFEGADLADSGAPCFVRSLPLALARERVLLATHMNGGPLTPEHGAPLRAIVPGWYAMASVKWLTRISLEPMPAPGPEMTQSYCYWREHADGWRATPVTEIRVKALITRPLEGARVPAGTVRVAGFAWSAGPVARVQVAADGAPWRDAALGHAIGPYAWRAWHAELTLAPGAHTIAARATDAAGATQPERVDWNRDGYGANAVTRVAVTVVPA